MTPEPAIGTPERPLRVAIVGSGPSGFYAAESLFRARDATVRVDVLDRLPTPYGLVRYGVAPDHQKMKAVIRVYEKTAGNPGFRFFGNVRLGTDVTVEDLRASYDQVVYAFGAETDRPLGVPGEDLAGSHSATAFVGWYNGHPDHLDGDYDLSVPTAVVFGIGNVAMDVARVLMRDPDELAETDIAAPALDALRASRVRDVWVVGRRGVAQAAFTPKEIEELGSLAGVDLVVDPAQLAIDAATEADLERDTNARKNVEYLREVAERGEDGQPRRIRMRFEASPVRLLGEGGRVTGVEIERNELVRDGDGRVKARGTGETEILPAGLVFRAIGYRGIPVPGVPYDERWGIVANEDGRVVDATTRAPRRGEYVVGWAKRGPSGLIGTNRGCSAATVERMLEDLPAGTTGAAGGARPLEETLQERGRRWVSFEDWRRLDALEVERGQAVGKIRERFRDVEEMLGALAGDAEAKS